MVRVARRDPQPLVRWVRSRTVPKVDSVGLSELRIRLVAGRLLDLLPTRFPKMGRIGNLRPAERRQTLLGSQL